MNIQDCINQAATVENAEQYAKEQDQFVFCLQLLGDISAHHPMADEWVNALEDEFDSLNNHGMTLADAQAQAEDESRAEQANEYAHEGVTNY